MSKVTSESAFEDSIQEHLLASGWPQGGPSGYDRSRAGPGAARPAMTAASA